MNTGEQYSDEITTAAERDALLGGTPLFSPEREEDWWRVQGVVEGAISPDTAAELRQKKKFMQSAQIEILLVSSGISLPKLGEGDAFGFSLPSSDDEGIVREIPQVGIWRAGKDEIETVIEGVNLAEHFWELREQYGELHLPHRERELAGAGSKERF